MNRLPLDRRIQIINALVEGNSIRSTERMTETHRDTIVRLMVQVGTGCRKWMDETLNDLTCRRIQVDEIWCFVGKKERHMTKEDDRRRVGDQWTYVAIDPETKLVPSWLVGKRDLRTAGAFLQDLQTRLVNRVQLSSDGLNNYVPAVEHAFGADVDYGQIVKYYEAEPIGPGRYSPPKVSGVDRTAFNGTPDPRHISTSHVERQNLTMRMSMRRFTRLTNAFSKKIENLRAAVDLHFAHYNMVRVHKSLRVTPAMAAGVSNRLVTLSELVERTTESA